jgi:hypothetical protein
LADPANKRSNSEDVTSRTLPAILTSQPNSSRL